MRSGTSEALEEYRRHLVLAEEDAQRSYDRTVLTLAGGGLGVSFTVASRLANDSLLIASNWLFAAWIMWGVSAVVTLISFVLSQRSLRKAIEQLDKGKIHDQIVGGGAAIATEVANYVAGALFVLGAIFFGLFLSWNMGG